MNEDIKPQSEAWLRRQWTSNRKRMWQNKAFRNSRIHAVCLSNTRFMSIHLRNVECDPPILCGLYESSISRYPLKLNISDVIKTLFNFIYPIRSNRESSHLRERWLGGGEWEQSGQRGNFMCEENKRRPCLRLFFRRFSEWKNFWYSPGRQWDRRFLM